MWTMLNRLLSAIAKQFREELQPLFQQQTDAIRDAVEAANQNNQQPLPVPLPVVAELHLPEADQRKQSTQYDKSHAVQIWLTFGTWLAFAAAATYAGIAAYQKTVMEKQLQASIHAMQIDQRPWIKADGFTPEYHPGEPMRAILPISNVGKSPALNFHIRMDYQILDPHQSFSLQHIRFRHVPIYNWGAVNPGQLPPKIETVPGSTNQYTVHATKWGHEQIWSADPISAQQLRLLRRGDLRVYIFEEATYSDVFGCSHYTHFCGWMRPTPTLDDGVACEIYNDTDTDPENQPCHGKP